MYCSYYYSTIIRLTWAEARPEVTAEEREKVNIIYVFNHLCIFIYIGAEVDVRDSIEYTALLWASLHGQEGVVRVLLEAGARGHRQMRQI